MQPEPYEFQCWKCGADLKSVPRPFSRFAECPGCKTDLHVCRMCRYYEPKYIGQCSHEFADKVAEKEKSNFCGHFRPDPNAFKSSGDSDKEKVQQELHDLFGHNVEPDDPREDPREGEAESEADAAKKRLNDLFGGD